MYVRMSDDVIWDRATVVGVKRVDIGTKIFSTPALFIAIRLFGGLLSA